MKGVGEGTGRGMGKGSEQVGGERREGGGAGEIIGVGGRVVEEGNA